MTLILMAPTEIAPRANAVPLPGGAPGGIGQSHPPTGGARTGSHAVRFAFVFKFKSWSNDDDASQSWHTYLDVKQLAPHPQPPLSQITTLQSGTPALAYSIVRCAVMAWHSADCRNCIQ